MKMHFLRLNPFISLNPEFRSQEPELRGEKKRILGGKGRFFILAPDFQIPVAHVAEGFSLP